MALSANNLLAKLSALDEHTLQILEKAEQTRDYRIALAAVRESRGNIEAFARIGPNAEIESRLAALEHPEQAETDGEP